MQSYNPLDSVIFGLEALVDIDPSRAYIAWSDEIDGDASEIENRMIDSGLVAAFDRGDLDAEAFFDAVRDVLENPLDDGVILDGWNQSVGEPLEGMLALVEKLSVSLRVSIIANTNPLHLDALHETCEELMDGVESVFASFELGVTTEDEALFEAVLETLSVDPDDVAFFDISQAALMSATSLGIRAFEAGDAETMGSDLDPLIDSIPDPG